MSFPLTTFSSLKLVKVQLKLIISLKVAILFSFVKGQQLEISAALSRLMKNKIKTEQFFQVFGIFDLFILSFFPECYIYFSNVKF